MVKPYSMSFKEDKKKRDAFLLAVYTEARHANPPSPLSVCFGLSKTKKYSLRTSEFINNDDERGGYILGERLGLSELQVDAIINDLADRNLIETSIGNMVFSLASEAIFYLEELEEPPLPLQVKTTTINVGTSNGPLQIQQEVNFSQQTQSISYSNEQIEEVFEYIRKDISKLSDELINDFNMEINYASRQMVKGLSIDAQLLNIGGLIKNVGLGVMSSLIASPIWEHLKPLFGY